MESFARLRVASFEPSAIDFFTFVILASTISPGVAPSQRSTMPLGRRQTPSPDVAKSMHSSASTMSPTRTSSCCCFWSPPPLNERAFADAQIVLEALCARRAVPKGVVDARDGALEMARMSAVMSEERMHASKCG